MEYTKIDLEDGEGGKVIVCNDCGAHTLDGNKNNIKHHVSCVPTKDEWIEPLTEEEMNENQW